MFTPIGAGGKRPGRRRPWRRAVSVLLVVLLLGAFGVGAYWWFFSGNRSTPETSPSTTPSVVCTTPPVTLPADLPAPADTKVEVLNGTKHGGLATDTADALVVAGFDVVAFGNADATFDGVAVVEYGKGDLPEAVVVASYFPGAALQRAKGNTGGVVTVTIGKQYTAVATAAQAKHNLASVALPAPSPICR